jgi:hypothetical protein
MEMYDVADIQAAEGDPQTITDLLLESLQVSREDRVDALKFMTGLPGKRLPAQRLRPWTYSVPFWQQYFRAATPEISVALSDADAWDFSLFDTF